MNSANDAKKRHDKRKAGQLGTIESFTGKRRKSDNVVVEPPFLPSAPSIASSSSSSSSSSFTPSSSVDLRQSMYTLVQRLEPLIEDVVKKHESDRR